MFLAGWSGWCRSVIAFVRGTAAWPITQVWTWLALVPAGCQRLVLQDATPIVFCKWRSLCPTQSANDTGRVDARGRFPADRFPVTVNPE